MTVTAVLRTGLRISHDGAVFTVVEMCGRRLVLERSGSGELRQVDAGWLLAQPGTAVASAGDPPAGTGTVLSGLDQDSERLLEERAGHVREVLTGYRLGSPDLALDGEPRPQYRPGTPKTNRYAAKAAELGIGVSTLRRWIAAFGEDGPAGLVPHPRGPRPGGAIRTDGRWIDMCRIVLAGHIDASRPTRAVIVAEVEQRLAEEHGPGTVPLPARTTAYELLRQISRGSNAFTGSTKGKRSIASAPQGVYGRLRATRPGEYVLLDTTPLDVFAMEPVTCRWVRAELTAAMDLYTRCITGLRLTPVSTKAADVAGVLYETVRPHPDSDGDGGAALPYHGVPGTVVVDVRKLAGPDGTPLLPSVAAETIVYDHGAVYLSRHVQSVCARFGISLQPARPRTPTDKSPLERWFRTLGDGLLVALPGYKGADVHSRGKDVEEQAFYFLHELEAIIRDWTAAVYHRRVHDGLCVPEVPGLQLSPLDMLGHGIERAGLLRIPGRADLAVEFLPVIWTSIQHYGVQIGGLRYQGQVLVRYRNQRSPYGGRHAGKWPFSADPGDVRHVWFQDPDGQQWHRLDWEHAATLGAPFSAEALQHARKLAAAASRFPDTTAAMTSLLDRWGAGLTASAAERRIAVRMSAERWRHAASPGSGPDTVTELASVQAITAAMTGPEPAAPPSDGDDAGRGGQETDSGGLQDFYADVMDSG